MFPVRAVSGALLTVVLLSGWGAGPPAAADRTASEAAVTLVAAAGPRPDNGAMLLDRGPNGQGVLEINNGTSADAVVRLVAGEAATHAVYVHHGATARVTKIPDASYTIYVLQGSGWDDARQEFTVDAQFSKFESTADFVTERTGGGIQYSEFSITLHPVVGGTAQVVDVDPASIPR